MCVCVCAVMGRIIDILLRMSFVLQHCLPIRSKTPANKRTQENGRARRDASASALLMVDFSVFGPLCRLPITSPSVRLLSLLSRSSKAARSSGLRVQGRARD